MKTNIPIMKTFTRAALLAAFASLAWLSSPAIAQEKGAVKLQQLNPIRTVDDIKAVEPGDTIIMSCPKCKTSWATVVQSPAKGGRTESKSVQQHQCPGCQTKISTEGHGKAATGKVLHICKNCGSEDAFCCVMKKGGPATPGMSSPK